jgi:hypothetical protein
MDFPNAGDLWLISTVYPDGTVAALEELVGNHGGLGGEQTDAFVFHPADMEVYETRNATDVFHILNNHRGKPVAAPPVTAEEKIADWAPGNLLKGLGQVWKVGRRRAALHDARPRRLRRRGQGSLHDRAGAADRPALVFWTVALLLVFAGGWLLTKQGSFTKTLRAVGFAHTVYLLTVFALLPGVSTAINFAILLWGFLCVWMGAATAHQTKGWRTLALPLVVLLVYVVGTAIVGVLLAGAEFTFQALMMELGLNN